MVSPSHNKWLIIMYLCVSFIYVFKWSNCNPEYTGKRSPVVSAYKMGHCFSLMPCLRWLMSICSEWFEVKDETTHSFKNENFKNSFKNFNWPLHSSNSVCKGTNAQALLTTTLKLHYQLMQKRATENTFSNKISEFSPWNTWAGFRSITK